MSTTRRQRAIAESALLLGALLFVCSKSGPAPPGPCPYPAESRSRAGWTVAVRCEVDPRVPRRAVRGPGRLLFGQTLDLNRADARSLESLPGIGPRRADAIERERCREGFASLADVERVPGIGPRTIARLRGWVHVGPPVPGRSRAVGCGSKQRASR